MVRRLAQLLILVLAFLHLPAFVPAPSWAHVSSAYAGDDDDWGDDDDDDDDDAGDDDDEDKTPQPPVTSGGLFTKKTYPIPLLDRPLTITQKMTEIRAGLDVDASDSGAFETWSLRFSGRYGIQDNVEFQASGNFLLTDTDNNLVSGTQLTAGIESAIAYDVVDFRLTAELPIDPTEFNVSFGFPVRYRLKPNIAIIAIDKLMTIHFDRKPDLTLGVGGVFQVIPKLAVTGRAELTIPEFDTNTVLIPATVGVLFSADRMFDLGAEFTLANLKVEKPASPIDNRFFFLFAQLRI